MGQIFRGTGKANPIKTKRQALFTNLFSKLNVYFIEIWSFFQILIHLTNV
tara:strand:- start:6493 stop:6642 length:150 start_codon:yes stop_codon:yes gene_type:complete